MKIYKHSLYSYVTVVQIPKAEIKRLDFAVCREPRETLEAYYERQNIKPDVLINGGLFNMSDGKSCMTMMDERTMMSHEAWAVDGMGIVDNATLICGKITQRNDWRDFVSGYPLLLWQGKRVHTDIGKELDYKTQRTALGYSRSDVFLVSVAKPGLDLYELQVVMRNIGCEYAINLDGGGSSRMLSSGRKIAGGVYSRPVDNVVAVYLKKYGEKPPHEGVIYRVQVGAFSNRGNADRLCDEIRRLPDPIRAGYSRAYVRKVQGLYKVQVGAFSNYDNAARVWQDLKDQGYSSFITSK